VKEMENSHGIAILNEIDREWERVFGHKLTMPKFHKLPYKTGKFKVSQILQKG
jgi:hypothetical protein